MNFHLFKAKSAFLVLFILIFNISSCAFVDSGKSSSNEIKDAEHYLILGHSNLRAGRHQEAVDAFKEAIKVEPDNAEAYHILGIEYAKSGMYKEAAESHKQAIRIKPDCAESHYMLGLEYAGLDMFKEGIEPLKQAIRIKPDYAEAHHLLGFTYSILGDKGSALEEYKILKELDKEKANNLFRVIYP